MKSGFKTGRALPKQRATPHTTTIPKLLSASERRIIFPPRGGGELVKRASFVVIFTH